MGIIMKKLKFELLNYTWRPVLTDRRGEKYFFPGKITAFMKENYKYPSVYRWRIFSDNQDTSDTVYIGEAQELCPKRIMHILNPGAEQMTNIRLKKIFEKFLQEGKKVGLEILSFDYLKIGDVKFTQEALKNKLLRSLLETLMIIESQKAGLKILNK